jgi:MoaA/NifB/PqqE/SkfB family radical SAM enzyme
VIAANARTATLFRLGALTNRTLVLPVVIFFPTSRCNSRCVSCDWWKSSGAGDLSLQEIASIAESLGPLGTRLILFSGGEPLLRPEVFGAAEIFRRVGIVLHLHTSGILLERCAEQVANAFSRVIVSLDASSEELYRTVRGVRALTTIERGVALLQRIAPAIPVTARATLHRMNFRELPHLIDHAKAMSLNGISFLAADVSSSAFGRDEAPRLGSLELGADEVADFQDIVEDTIRDYEPDFVSGFIAESPDKLRRLPRYYAALLGESSFPPVSCNAPYMSVVIEADGAVRPCFFHRPIGSTRLESLESIVRRNLPAFRETLTFETNPICTRCVCSMRAGWRHAPWQ